VKNPSKTEMEKGLAGEEARTRENEWFKEHPNFGRLSVGSSRFGVSTSLSRPER
jgi:hypothetical protein